MYHIWVQGALKIFASPWLRPRLLFPKFIVGFCSDRACECVALPVPEIIEVARKIWGVSDYANAPCSPKNHIGPPYRLFLYAHSFSRNFRLEFWVTVADLQYRGRGVGRREWYRPKERWWVPIGPPYRSFLYQHSFARNFRSGVWWGLRSPKFRNTCV